jgi:O-antigen/teichoic acid export membrane protein
MLAEVSRDTEAKASGKPRNSPLIRLVRQGIRRLGWGVADQAVSSLTNFAVSIFVARSVGLVQFGAFSLAYVTYGFALNASRGLATDPLMVRFSGVEPPVWRRAVASCSGTAVTVGVATGICALVAAALLGGTARLAFFGLALTLPGLMLQDSWRFAFFASGRGKQALLNDLVWGVMLLPALLILRSTGHGSVFWFVFAWGAAANVAALVGPLQARVIPKVSGTWGWLSRHRDLGPRYLAEGTASAASNQLRIYGVGLIVGLAAVGSLQAANTLMGPFMVIFYGLSLVTIPEAAHVLRTSPRHLPLFSLVLGTGLAIAAVAWGIILLIALPRGLGGVMLGRLWRPAYPLVLPTVIAIVGACFNAGVGAGLHALGAARRSLRAMVLTSAIYIVLGIAGAALDGVVGAARGAAAANWLGTIVWWWQLTRALRESDKIPENTRFWPSRPAGRHRGAEQHGGAKRKPPESSTHSHRTS